MTDDVELKMKNTAETMRETMEAYADVERIDEPDINIGDPHLVAVPDGKRVLDLTDHYISAAEIVKPLRRKGTAKLTTLDSLCDWANRFKGSSSALFASTDPDAPALRAIIDYHQGGEPVLDGHPDPAANHCGHQGLYKFPLSREWKAWMSVADRKLGKDDLGEFIEAHAKDIQDPTPAIISGDTKKAADWETRLILIAKQIEGRFAQISTLLSLSRQFQVFETSDLTIKTNRDTGEAEVQFLNEHKTATGKKLDIPNLLIIAIPVFEGGDLYRMPVRFRYRKSGSAVTFTLTPYAPERAFDMAIEGSVAKAVEATKLPIFYGSPET